MHRDSQQEAAAEAEQYVTGAIGGDAEAFGRLYDLHVGRVYNHIYYRVGNVKDAEDLTQQVFLKAWKAIGRYRRTASPFLAWLLRISHNLVIDFYRARKDTVYLDIDVASTDADSRPERQAEAHYDQRQVRQAILQLPYEQQQVVMMSYLEGFSYTEIAAALGKKEGNIRVIMHRALKKLRAMLEPEPAAE